MGKRCSRGEAETRGREGKRVPGAAGWDAAVLLSQGGVSAFRVLLVSSVSPIAVCELARIPHFPQPSRPAPEPAKSPGAAQISRSCVMQGSVAKDLDVGMNILTLRDFNSQPCYR